MMIIMHSRLHYKILRLVCNLAQCQYEKIILAKFLTKATVTKFIVSYLPHANSYKK